MAGLRLRHTLATGLVNELVEAADEKVPAKTVARYGFTEWGANRIGRGTPDGRIDEHDLPSASSEPHGIARGPDGATWTAAVHSGRS